LRQVGNDALVGQIREARLEDIEFHPRFGRRMYPGEPIHNGLPWVIDCMKRPIGWFWSRTTGWRRFGIFAYGFIKRVQLEILVSSRAMDCMCEFLSGYDTMGQFQKATALNSDRQRE